MNGTADSFFSEINNNSNPQALNGIVLPGAPSVTFANHASVILPPNRYFQYQYIMESDASITVDTCGYSGGGACSPELRTVSVAPNTGYPTNAPGISYNVAIPYYTLSGSFTESVTCPAGVKYLLSVDNATWKWWDGSAWATSNGTAAQSNSLGTLNSNVATFATSVGRTSLYVKALLQSNGTLNCTIDAFGVTGNNVF